MLVAAFPHEVCRDLFLPLGATPLTIIFNRYLGAGSAVNCGSFLKLAHWLVVAPFTFEEAGIFADALQGAIATDDPIGFRE